MSVRVYGVRQPDMTPLEAALADIENAMGLHECLDIIYIPVGVRVEFNVEDGNRTLFKAETKTLAEAFLAIAGHINQRNWLQIREFAAQHK